MKNIPTAETIKKRTAKAMRGLGVFKTQYNPIISRYAELVYQYNFITREFERSGYQLEVDTGQNTVKKSPTIASLESLRKDLVVLEDRLMLNPKAIGENILGKDAPASPLMEALKKGIPR